MVGILVHDCVLRISCSRIYAIDPAAVAPKPDRGARAQGAVDDRTAGGKSGLVARFTALCERQFAATVDAGLGQAWRRGDVAHGAAFRAGTEQRALRPAQ